MLHSRGCCDEAEVAPAVKRAPLVLLLPNVYTHGERHVG